MGTLRTHVHVADENGRMHVFGPDDDVPAWAAKRITNPDAWVQADEPVPNLVDGPPPMSGSGSGRDAWAAYAAAHNVEVAADAKRDDIIAALDAASVQTTAE